MNAKTTLWIAIVGMTVSAFAAGTTIGRLVEKRGEPDYGLLADTVSSWYMAGKASGRAECSK